jgi:hypothetical protein
MLELLDRFWTPIVQCYTLTTPFGLLISLLQSQSHVTTITHNYFLTRWSVHTTYKHLYIRDYSHLLRTYTYTLADLLAINCLKLSETLHLHTSILSPRIHLTVTPGTASENSVVELPRNNSVVELLLKNSSRELLVANWLRRHFRSAYKPSIAPAARAVLRHSVYQRCRGDERASVWRYRSCAEKTPPPLTTKRRVSGRELFTGRCLATLLRHPTKGRHVTIFSRSHGILETIIIYEYVILTNVTNRLIVLWYNSWWQLNGAESFNTIVICTVYKSLAGTFLPYFFSDHQPNWQILDNWFGNWKM